MFAESKPTPEPRSFTREYEVLGRKLQVHQGDITRLAVDAIVSSENSDLVMDRPDGPSVSAAIRRIEGEELARDLARLGPIEPGRAVVTPTRHLPCKYVIHAATVIRTEAGHQSSLQQIREAVRSALRLASGLGLQSLALPAFGVRAAQLPREATSQAMVEELVAGLRERTTLRRVVVALTDPESFLAFFEVAMRRAAAANEPLRLRVQRHGDEVAWSIDEAAPLQHLLVRRLPPGAQQELLDQVARLRHAAGRRLLDARRELEALGARVRTVVPDEVLERVRADGPRPVELRLDEGLAGIPFELCADGDRHLCERAPVARRLVTLAPAAPSRPAEAPGRLVALLVAPADGGDLPAAAREAAQVLDLLWRRAGDRLELTYLGGRRATRQAILDALPRAALLHWCGHTRLGQDGAPCWHLGQGELLGPDDLARARLAARLVVGNSCSPDDGVRLARALLLGGARNVVSTLWEVDDAAAERFGLRLYEDLALGRTLGEALGAARDALRKDDPLHWAAYVHYGDARERVVEPVGL